MQIQFNWIIMTEKRIKVPQELLTGTGINQASLAISDGSTYDYGGKDFRNGHRKNLHYYKTRVVCLQRVLVAQGCPLPLILRGVTERVGPARRLLTFGTCTVVVEYNPTVTGSHSDTFNP